MPGKSIISKKFIGIFISGLAVAGILTASDSFAIERKTKAGTSLVARVARVVAESRDRKGIAPRIEQRERADRHQDRKVIVPSDVRRGRTAVEQRDRRVIAPRSARQERFGAEHRDRKVTTPRIEHRERGTDRFRDRYTEVRTHRDRDFPRYNVIGRHGIHRPYASWHAMGRPRVGVIFSTLPVGYRTIWIADRWYYFYNGIYYQSAPYGYVVVNPPPVVVVREYPDVVEPLEHAQGWVAVTVSTLNVHAGSTLDHPVIYQITLDTVLEVYGKADGWLYVQLPNGEFGWIMAAFTAEVEPPGSS